MKNTLHTFTFKAPEALLQRLEKLAAQHDRNKSYLIRKAIEHYLAEREEEEEDYRIAMERLAKDDPKKRVSWKAIKRKYGLGN